MQYNVVAVAVVWVVVLTLASGEVRNSIRLACCYMKNGFCVRTGLDSSLVSRSNIRVSFLI